MKKGYTLVEALLALFFSSLLMVLILSMLYVLNQSKESMKSFDQNRIGLIQLQNELSLGSDYTQINNQICYVKFESEFCLEIDSNRLVKTPGYEIYLTNIKEGQLSLYEKSIQFTSAQLEHTFNIIP